MEVPLALYSDRHAAFKYNARQAPVLAESTQFARVMRELGIRQIYALSPQAKGRVERMGSTLQDRLVTELRLAGAATILEANDVLQQFLPLETTRSNTTGGSCNCFPGWTGLAPGGGSGTGDGQLMIGYHGETVDFQESPQPLSSLWGDRPLCSGGRWGGRRSVQ